MNKKIFSVILAASMAASMVSVFAEDVMPISAENDIILISPNPVNEYEGKVTEIKDNAVTVEIEGVSYTFVCENVEDIQAGDDVVVTSTASLKTKDIKEATSIVKQTAETDAIAHAFNSYSAIVKTITADSITVAIEDAEYEFKITEATKLLGIAGEEVSEVKAEEEVIVVSESLLKTKDIKVAAAIVVKNTETEMAVYADNFKLDGERLTSESGDLILNMEGDLTAYDGKSLLVFYDIMTMSLPAQTNPVKVVVLGEAITEEEPEVKPEKAPATYNSYAAEVKAVENKQLQVAIDGLDYTFAVDASTLVYSITGEQVKDIKVGDKVNIFSASSLKTKDIKSATAVVVMDNADVQMSVCVDIFKLEGESLISADGELVLNMENAKAYDGKTLLVFYDMMTMSIPAQTNPVKVVPVSCNVQISFKVGDAILNINGNKVEVVKPFVAGAGTTLVPLRVISEAFGAQVDWNGETKTVTIENDGVKISVAIDSKAATVNGDKTVELEEAPQLLNDSTMVPLRFISEQLGAVVSYDNDTQLITVERK